MTPRVDREEPVGVNSCSSVYTIPQVICISNFRLLSALVVFFHGPLTICLIITKISDYPVTAICVTSKTA